MRAVCRARAYFNDRDSDKGQAAGVQLSKHEIRDGSVRGANMVNLRDKVNRHRALLTQD
jgi:hypothetical protein